MATKRKSPPSKADPSSELEAETPPSPSSSIESAQEAFALFSQTQTTSATFSSPLPPAAELRGLSELNPTFPERLLAMVEREQQHQHTREHAEQVARTGALLRAQWMAFGLDALLTVSGIGVVIAAVVLHVPLAAAGGPGFIIAAILRRKMAAKK